MIRIGPAGWSYPDWDGRVYPSPKPPGFHPLVLLSKSFACIEINSTFYALPRAEHAQRWVELVREHPRFRFIAKLNRDFTHITTREAEERAGVLEGHARAFNAGLVPLQRAKRLAGLLVQFPISFLFGKDEVRRLGRLRALFPDTPLVLEVRHESWFTPPARDTVRGLSYSLAYIDLPAAWNHPPPWHEPTGPVGYLRLHGRNSEHWFREESGRDQRYDYLYAPGELAEIAQRARAVGEAHPETYVITNNHFGGKAVANALEIAFLLSGEKQPAPPEIVAAFPRLAGAVRPEGQGSLF
ncbi:MAG: DUF72 domain-containing protein [Planctomycetes bacterium]|nr:DUF72 domain-containing protein [Planctomycetota bacterium]